MGVCSKVKNGFNKVKYFTTNLIGEIFYKTPVVKNIEESLEKIINDKCSVARYGDGEFNLAFGNSIDFQTCNEKIKRKLREILVLDDENFMVCITGELYSNNIDLNPKARKYWKNFITKNRLKLATILKKNKIYYSASITRFYMNFINKDKCERYAELLKKIWHDRDVVFVEGKSSRLGVGNDFFDNAKSVRRILCPENQAFDVYDEIISAVNSNVEKGALILLALGPTATVMAYDLYKEGYQVVDIGHVDIEYEWMRMKATEKVAVKGKYVNEVEEGKIVLDISDEKYLSQIIKKVGV